MRPPNKIKNMPDLCVPLIIRAEDVRLLLMGLLRGSDPFAGRIGYIWRLARRFQPVSVGTQPRLKGGLVPGLHCRLAEGDLWSFGTEARAAWQEKTVFQQSRPHF